MVSTRPITTAEQLFEAGDIGRCELIRGELKMMSPAGGRHGALTNRLAYLLTRHITPSEGAPTGIVYAAETGFVLERNPDTVRAPDIAFIRAERAPGPDAVSFLEVAPDLVVETLSPTDRAGEVLGKVRDWLRFGCRMVWVVDPKSRTVTVHHPGGEARVLSEAEELTGGDVLPGFGLPLRDLFEGHAPPR